MRLWEDVDGVFSMPPCHKNGRSREGRRIVLVRVSQVLVNIRIYGHVYLCLWVYISSFLNSNKEQQGAAAVEVGLVWFVASCEVAQTRSYAVLLGGAVQTANYNIYMFVFLLVLLKSLDLSLVFFIPGTICLCHIIRGMRVSARFTSQ